MGAACLALALPAHGRAQERMDRLGGYWEGALTRGGSVQVLALRVPEQDDIPVQSEGAGATYSIPELGFFDLPLEHLSIRGDSVELGILYGRFQGRVHDTAGEIAAVSSGPGPRTTVHLKRALPPPGCRSDTLSLPSGGVRLAATILRPKGPGPHPGAVVLHDSAPRHRGHRSYRVYAELYCRAGIASLIYDKRGVGASGGDYDAASIDDLAGDAMAAWEALSRQPDVAADRVGLIGFSNGGWLGPLAASRMGSAAFVVMVAGPSVSVWDQERQRVEYSMRADGFPEIDIEAALAHTDAVFAAALDPARWPDAEASVALASRASWVEYVDLPESREEAAAWMLERYDPQPVLESLETPLLAIFGGRDTFVPPEENVELLRSYLQRAGNTAFEIHLLPEMGHSIYRGEGPAPDGDFPDAVWRWDRLVPGLFETIVPWTLRQVGRR